MSKVTQCLGAWGEGVAVAYLRTKNYVILGRNFRIPQGEIDIIARVFEANESVLCFIEVKTRARTFGSAERATHAQKLTNMSHAAMAYCLKNAIDTDRTSIRFEQISVYEMGAESEPLLRHYHIPFQ